MSKVGFDISDIIDDPDWNQAFKIRRYSERINEQGRAYREETESASTGVIWPSTGEELKRLPESDRVESTITVATRSGLSAGYAGHKPDEIEWCGEWYRVVNVQVWKDYGFSVAMCQNLSMNGNEYYVGEMGNGEEQ